MVQHRIPGIGRIEFDGADDGCGIRQRLAAIARLHVGLLHGVTGGAAGLCVVAPS
ncbi:hypothetical protein [Neoroseomonas lacus]|uniref:hypothetical protein n=1 Tax=Neoroseomonas lacus TaxID=287609 RepID=UPI001E4B2B21|nr:hypothetical protein [Neoroseomonas lacus]